MSKQRRILGLGLMAGAAIGYWLNTDRGKAFRRDIAEKIGEISDEVSATAKDNAVKLSGNLTHAMEDGQSWVAGTKNQLKSSIHDFADTAEQVVDKAGNKIESSLEKARQKVQENTSKINKEDGKSES